MGEECKYLPKVTLQNINYQRQIQTDWICKEIKYIALLVLADSEINFDSKSPIRK